MTVKARPRGLAHRSTSLREFSSAVELGRARADRFRADSPASALLQNPALVREALHELQVHQEELTVADEELRAQLEELSAVTARAQLERDRYRELFDLSPDGYFLTDLVGVIRDVNASGAALLGIETRFLIGKPLVALLDAADVRSLRGAIEVLRKARSVEVEVRLKPRNAEPIWYALKAAQVEDGEALLWIARDVHARRTLADGLAVSREVLEAHARDRLVELERANRDKDELLVRERSLRKQLEEAHAAKDRFLAVLSHDLRAPLNAVLGWTQLLRREKLDQTARDRALATIERSARAQGRLVEELLDVSRIAADKVQLERVAVELAELVRRASDAALPDAIERGIAVTVTTPPEPVVVSGDRKRLEQVVSNLASNALKFTPPGGRVTLTLETTPSRARLVVEDTGRGIAPELLPHVFDAFRQSADYATAGEGLGLYIVRRAVEMHSGTAVAESEGIGKGTRIVVELPTIAAALGAAPREAPRHAPDSLAGVRVMVVDDDEDARELMAAVLRQRGALVSLAADVASALSACEASPPDVVVSDIGMPGRGGLELVKELRARPQTSHTTLIAVSGFAAAEQVDLALDAGFDVHLAKPFEPSELVSVIGEAARPRR